jgi:CBS domain-containing protein
MNVGEICVRNVVTVQEFDELTKAAQLMREQHVGYLIVVGPKAGVDSGFVPVGVLTDRDIVVGVVAKDTDPKALRVSDLMTREPVVVDESASISTALGEMRRIGIRRIPVTGRNGFLVGVLSLDDVLCTLSADLVDVAGSVRNEVRVEKALRP